MKRIFIVLFMVMAFIVMLQFINVNFNSDAGEFPTLTSSNSKVEVPFFHNYRVLEYRVIDGDTVEFFVDLGFDTYRRDNFRMLGYDAPETFRPKNDSERAAGKRVKEYLQKLLDDNSGYLFINSNKHGKYRYLATIYSSKGGVLLDINEMVLGYMKSNHLTKEEVR